MQLPKQFYEGIEEFIQTHSEDDKGLVIIPSSKGPTHVRQTLKLFRESGLEFPEERKFEYIPPQSVSHLPVPRTEKVPVLDTTLKYLLMDDTVETGNTLRIALQRITEQGIGIEDIWCYTSILMNPRKWSSRPHMDRAQAFQDYIASIRTYS
tara:strand:+ start:23095 stop:23550 length:456 start_codon:yes stop_codon:yes gene_type:complete